MIPQSKTELLIYRFQNDRTLIALNAALADIITRATIKDIITKDDNTIEIIYDDISQRLRINIEKMILEVINKNYSELFPKLM